MRWIESAEHCPQLEGWRAVLVIVLSISENCSNYRSKVYAEFTPIRLRSDLHPISPLCTRFLGQPLSSFVPEGTLHEPGSESTLAACHRGKQRASLAGNQSLPAIMSDLPVLDASARAAPVLASIEHPRSKENSHLMRNHPSSNRVHRNELPVFRLDVVVKKLIAVFVKVIDPNGQTNLQPQPAAGVLIPTRAI